MSYKFEKLEVWQLALEYSDLIYELAEQLPTSENYNLKSQITRAANSIALNIAEGSTSQSDAEQARFLSLALRSLVETVACQHLINRRSYLAETEKLRETYRTSETLFAKIQALRRSLKSNQIRDDQVDYETDDEIPF
ncbi:MAG TPA: four helix bundle protein [Chloroflexi bacterium]|nr:four helix bundle protein [Chloroflexota bacterium]